MKRTWLGLGLLLIFLVAGCLVTFSFHRIYTPTAQILEEASQKALDGQWENACAGAKTALERWNRYRNFTAAVADHAPLEEMDALFSQLEIYMQLNWQGEFALLCAQLAQMSAAMEESQAFTWWTML